MTTTNTTQATTATKATRNSKGQFVKASKTPKSETLNNAHAKSTVETVSPLPEPTRKAQAYDMDSTALNRLAVLVYVSVSLAGFTRRDRTATKTVVKHHGISRADAREVGHFTKNLLPRECLKPLQTAANSIKTYVNHHTLPFEGSGKGRKLLPINHFDRFIDGLNDRVKTFEDARDHFIAHYPEYKRQARIILTGTGNYGLYIESEYPDESELEGMFTVVKAIDPVPTRGHFIVDIQKEEISEIQSALDERVNSAVNGAMGDLWKRVFRLVKHMANKLRAYKVSVKDGKKKTDGIFKDSLVENLREVCELLPELNFAGDPELYRLQKEIEDSLCVYEPDTLRENAEIRKETAKKAEAILDSISSFMA